MHDELKLEDGCKRLITKPRHIGSSGDDHIGVLRSLDLPLDILQSATKAWRCTGCQFFLKGCPTTAGSVRCISTLVAAGAFSGACFYTRIANDDAERVELRKLEGWAVAN